MKTKCFILIVILGFSYNLFSQETLIKKFDKTQNQSGEVSINKSSIKIDGDNVYRIFEVNAPEDGDYYLSAFILVANKKDNSRYYDIQVNDNVVKDRIQLNKDNWQCITIKDKACKHKTIRLKKGTNIISFISNAPEILEVESIVISRDIFKASISDKNYTDYVKDLKTQKLPVNYSDIKKVAIEAKKSGSHLKSYKLSNPEGNYGHEMELDFNYTYYSTLYLTEGQTITLETKDATSDPVLHLFNSTDPMKGSWTNDDGGTGYNSKITAKIKYTGVYYVLIRKYPSSVGGTCDLYNDGNLFVSNVAVAGNEIRCDRYVMEELNYFTKLTSGDTRIWIEDQTDSPGLIVAYNDDYHPDIAHDFVWGYASRVKRNFNWHIGAVIVSNYSASNPVGKCDLYMNCKNSSIMKYFPNLKADDAIQSAPATRSYNCISWTGGITDFWEWPGNSYSTYWVGSPLASFDNFYSTSRYDGAMTYSRLGATLSNSVIDLWYHKNYNGHGYGDYTHGSITKPSNNHPHGYDWESKPGSEMRTFHPRNSLSSNETFGYGYVSNYYVPTSLKEAMLLDESIARGLSVIENIELTKIEKTIVSDKINSLTISQRDEFEKKYNKWKLTWEKPEIAIQSNPRMYARSDEYKELIQYCKKQGESVWPLVFDKFQQGDFFSINALEDLTLDENQSVLEKVKYESNLKSATESGAVIVRSPQTIAMKYIKEMLKSSSDVPKSDEDGISYSNSLKFSVFPNPVNTTSQISFVLPTDAIVSAQVIDLNGRVLSVIINEQMVKAGNQSYSLNVPANLKGTCLVKLLVNNNVNVQLIVVH